MISDERDVDELDQDETLEGELGDELEVVDEELDVLDDADDLSEDDEGEDEEAEEEEEDSEEEEEEGPSTDESGSTSLEELLAKRRASRPGGEDAGDVDDLIALSSEAARADARTRSKVAPVRNREEFVCKRCFLVKPKVQLADAERVLCRDCA